MESKTGGETPVTPEDASSDVARLVLFASILIAAATLITLIALGAGARSSFTVFDIPDLQGLQMKNWVTGRRFGFDGPLLTGGDKSIWMRWARMPLPIWTIAGLRIVFGSGMIAVNVAKAVLRSLPLILSFAPIQCDCRTSLSSRAKWGRLGGASVRIVIARRSRQSGDNVGKGGLYRIADRALHDDAPLSKQLGVGCSKWSCDLSRPSLWHPHRQYLSLKELNDCGRDCHGDRALGRVENLRLTLFAAIPLRFAAIPLRLAMLCWEARTAADGGRISFGTSLDGYNLRKGNNPTFLEHYPPPFNMNIDPFYADIGVGHHYKSESDFDAGQRRKLFST
jgi:hypothetical protein